MSESMTIDKRVTITLTTEGGELSCLRDALLMARRVIDKRQKDGVFLDRITAEQTDPEIKCISEFVDRLLDQL